MKRWNGVSALKGENDVTRVLCMCLADWITFIILTVLTVRNIQVSGTAQILRTLELRQTAHIALTTEATEALHKAKNIDTQQTLQVVIMAMTAVTVRSKGSGKAARIAGTVQIMRLRRTLHMLRTPKKLRIAWTVQMPIRSDRRA